ncbi:MAG: hypothetical protein D6689_18795 [Deltaproteobacteria bacterium]|nr:MAG: hypothetical protein D6689_18795 [Deltaproteobacteria bacterium]
MTARGHALALCAAAAIAAPRDARAHGRSVSYSRIDVDADGAAIRVRVRAVDATAIAAAGLSPDRYVPAAVAVDGCAPVPESFVELRADVGWRSFEWRVACASRPREARVDLLFDLIAGHVHFASAGGEEHLVTDTHRTVALADRRAGARSVARPARYVALGVHHILSGFDHLVFLFALVVAAASARDVAVAATGFTLGHSATLALAATGAVAPPAAAIEALIGLSIAVVAVENLWLDGGRRDPWLPGATVAAIATVAVAGPTHVPRLALAGIALVVAGGFGLVAGAARPARYRAAIAALFGLVHGFGFAAAFPAPDRVVVPLVAFNGGVELGQLALIAASYPALAWARRRGWPVAGVGSAVALALGVYWFASRAA